MSQAEFKIGDRVEVLVNPVFGNAFQKGWRGHVVGIEEGPIYVVQFDVHEPGSSFEFLGSALDLISSGFKIGDEVFVKVPGLEGSTGTVMSTDLGGGLYYVEYHSNPGTTYLTENKFMRLLREEEARDTDKVLSMGDITTPEPTPRADVLDEAKALITGDRNNSYGEPTQDFQRSADALTGLGYGKKDHEGDWVGLEAHDVSILVMAIKLSRLQWSPGKRDHWADIAGYAGCGYECAVKEGHAE